MTNQQNGLPSREEFFNYLLVKRRPEVTDPESTLAKLTKTIGAEAIVRTIDAVDGFATPEPSEIQLAAFGLYKQLQDETNRCMWVTIG